MKKLYSLILIFALILPYFMPLSTIIAATDEYSVVSIKSDGTINEIGKYDNYNSAKIAMNNYNSTTEDVAAIKRNGNIVYVKYGIFKPSTSNVTLTFSTDYGNRYMSPAYNSETLFLDYNPDTNKVQIMISGVKGWVNASQGIIHPISYITDGSNLSYDPSKKYVKIIYQNGIRLREGPGTEYKQVGCNGAQTCTASEGGIWTTAGAIYEWLNYGEVTTNGSNEWYKVNINGNVGFIANGVGFKDLEEFSATLGNKMEFKALYYVNSSNELYHQYYVDAVDGVWSTRLGKAPLYLKKDATYYSFDGNYFYLSFRKMVDDLRNNNHDNAVNKMPYYNYYQYLPTRTQTTYNADNLNDYIGYDAKIDRSKYYELVYDESTKKYKWTSYGNWSSFPKEQSMLYGEGESFIESQTKYGVNAAQTLALAINESGWGRSYMAVREYNIFGHGAFDTAPDEHAASYESIKAGIMAHAYKYIALNYSNPIDGYNYYGSHYGNKLSGNNVSYASDAYWGEKMASNYYALDKNFDFQDFKQRPILGIKEVSSAAPVYSNPSTDSTKYYNLKNIPNIPVTILDEVEGQNINGNNIWYKIQSDVPIDENRKLVDLKLETYNFETSYAYIHSSYIYKESKEPIINASDLTLKFGTTFDSLKDVSAYDAWDGDVTSKIKVDSNVDTEKAGKYNVTYTVTDSENNAATKTINVEVLSSLPTIVATDKTINIGNKFNVLDGVTASDAEDGNITSKITITKNNVDINKAGTYNITYSVTDKDKNTVTKTITVKVISNKPVIVAIDKTINIGSKFNELEGVTATDTEDGNITNKIIITKNTVDTNKAGTYNVTYSVTDTHQNTVTKTITVKVISNKPVIEANNKTLLSGDKFNPLDGVKATDKEDGDITKNIIVTANNVDINKAGTYSITYSITDKDKNTVTKTISVSVLERKLETKDAIFYLDYLKNVNGKLQIKGYNTINGIDNNLDEEINYEIIFTNINNGNIYTQNATRITDKKEMSRPVYGLDDMDYTYSWFKLDIDLANLPDGNYQMEVVSKSSKYKSISVISNKLYKTQDTSFEGEKSVVTRNNFDDKKGPIELIIRSNSLAKKTASATYNQYDTYRVFEFTKDGLLHLKGVSYSFGMDLNSNKEVSREIIFENVNDYNSTYRYKLGSTKDGLYKVVLPVDDNLAKDRAWYDKTIDITNIPIGRYVIYMTTSSNITDIAEFTEKLNRDVSGITLTKNNKKYRFEINKNRGNRIELIVEKV